MGDDEQFEYIYRYVSNQPWRQARAAGINPLDDGVLYVARFLADGTGEWLPLMPGAPGLRAAGRSHDILVNTRLAADGPVADERTPRRWTGPSGSTRSPTQLTGIVTLTNNSSRGRPGTNPAPASPPRSTRPTHVRPNPYGHILRWYYANDFTEPTFGWDIFALVRRPGDRGRRHAAQRPTSSGRPTALTWRRAAGSGSRPTCRRAQSTPARTPASGTTRCSAPIRRRGRSGASSSDRRGARSPACFVTPDETDDVRGDPAPGRARQWRHRAREPQAVQLVAPRADPGAAPVVLHRHHKDDGGEIGS